MSKSFLNLILPQVSWYLFAHSSQSIFLLAPVLLSFWEPLIQLRKLWYEFSSVLSQLLSSPFILWVLTPILVSLQRNPKWCLLGTSTWRSTDLSHQARPAWSSWFSRQPWSPALWPDWVTAAASFGFIPLSNWCCHLSWRPSLTPSYPWASGPANCMS